MLFLKEVPVKFSSSNPSSKKEFMRSVLSVWIALAIVISWTGFLSAQSTKSGIPGPIQMHSLVKETILDFALAVKAEDFSAFYKKIAKLWQKQTSAQELTNIFQSFYGQGLDLTFLQNVYPAYIKKPTLDSKGWLVLEGFYPTQPSVTNFSVKYAQESRKWKLVAIDVKIKPGNIPIPPDKALKDMADATVLELAIAVKAKDFQGFYNSIAELWRSQTTPKGLAQNFKSFTDQNIDLTVLQNLDPVFSEKPAYDETGWLVLTGYYPSRPSQAFFTMKYINELGEWKLVGVDLDLKSK